MWRKNKGIKTLSISLDFNNKRTRIHCINCIHFFNGQRLFKERKNGKQNKRKSSTHRVHLQFKRGLITLFRWKYRSVNKRNGRLRV